MKTGPLTPLERVLQLPLDSRVALMDFLTKNTRDLGSALDAEEQHITRLAALKTQHLKRRTC